MYPARGGAGGRVRASGQRFRTAAGEATRGTAGRGTRPTAAQRSPPPLSGWCKPEVANHTLATLVLKLKVKGGKGIGGGKNAQLFLGDSGGSEKSLFGF